MVRAETGFVKEQYKLILRWERRYTAGHDPETSKTIYKNVLGRTQEEAKEKLNAAIKETQSLDLQKLYKKLLTKDWVDRLEWARLLMIYAASLPVGWTDIGNWHYSPGICVPEP